MGNGASSPNDAALPRQAVGPAVAGTHTPTAAATSKTCSAGAVDEVPPAAAAPLLNPAARPAASTAVVRRRPVISDDPLAVVALGVSLRGLRRLRARLADHFAAEGPFDQVTTTQVCMEWVRPATAASKCRAAEDPALIDPSDVGPPAYFISHAWSNAFELLLRTVEAFLSSADEGTCVWVDVLAVNQVGWGGSRAQKGGGGGEARTVQEAEWEGKQNLGR